MHHPAAVDRRPFLAAVVQQCELAVIESETVQDGSVDVVDMDAIFDGIKPDNVGGAVGDSAFDAAAGHPHGKAKRIVIAAVAAFAHRCPAKLASPYNQRRIEQAATLQI